MILLFFLLGLLIGWLYAHSVVATECERLGKFYVGKNIYHCTKIENIGDQ